MNDDIPIKGPATIQLFKPPRPHVMAVLDSNPGGLPWVGFDWGVPTMHWWMWDTREGRDPATGKPLQDRPVRLPTSHQLIRDLYDGFHHAVYWNPVPSKPKGDQP